MGVRLDMLLLDCLGTVAVSVGGPRAEQIWNGVLRDVAAEKLKECGVPDRPLSAIDAARHIGILGPDPDVIEVKRKRRATRVST